MAASRASGVSPKTNLPRFVIRIRKGDRFYYYFRHGDRREPLPQPSDPRFAAEYSSRLVANGLLDKAATPLARHTVRQKVYFIENTFTRAIKIGLAKWPQKRLSNLQIGSADPLRLLAVVEGGPAHERALHSRWADHRTRGEWFSPHPEILAEIERLSRPTPPRTDGEDG